MWYFSNKAFILKNEPKVSVRCKQPINFEVGTSAIETKQNVDKKMPFKFSFSIIKIHKI